MAGALREMYRIRQFRLEICLESFRDAYLQDLEIIIRIEVAKGSYDFLPYPPVVFYKRPLLKEPPVT